MAFSEAVAKAQTSDGRHVKSTKPSGTNWESNQGASHEELGCYYYTIDARASAARGFDRMLRWTT